MPKARINKFIFMDGKIFLRLKSTARTFSVKKLATNYVLEFFVGLKKGEFVTVPVNFIESFDPEEVIPADIMALDLSKTKTSQMLKDGAEAFVYDWGELIKVQIPGDNSQIFYYLVPTQRNFAVKVGPIAAAIDNVDIKLDWPNVQWGIE